MNDKVLIPLRVAIVTDSSSYYEPLFAEHNCHVLSFARDQISKAVDTVNIYRNQQVFDLVFIDYFPGVENEVLRLRKVNPGLCIRYLFTSHCSGEVKSVIEHPVISSLVELKKCLRGAKLLEV